MKTIQTVRLVGETELTDQLENLIWKFPWVSLLHGEGDQVYVDVDLEALLGEIIVQQLKHVGLNPQLTSFNKTEPLF